MDYEGFDLLGIQDDETEVGLEVAQGLGSMFQGLSGITSGVTDIVAKKKAEDEAIVDSAAKVDAAKKADIAAANARATAETSKQLKSASMDADEEVAKGAEAAQKTAADALSGKDADLRAQAAESQKGLAATAWQKNPKDVRAKALFDAWSKIATKGNFATIDKKSTESVQAASGNDEGSILTRPIAGTPVRPWHVGVIGVLGGLAWKFMPRGK